MHHTPSEALFRQCADADTLQVYPFHFELDVLFRMEGNALTIFATVRNVGDEIMPASIGFHPAFRWPLAPQAARAAHFIEFECDEPAPVRRLDRDGLITNEHHATPVDGKRLVLHDELFTQDVVIFDQLLSRRLIYGATSTAAASGPRIAVSFPDATHLGLWTKPGAGFICIEPWRGVADPAGFTGEFQHKPGAFAVAPGSSQSLTMRIEVS